MLESLNQQKRSIELYAINKQNLFYLCIFCQQNNSRKYSIYTKYERVLFGFNNLQGSLKAEFLSYLLFIYQISTPPISPKFCVLCKQQPKIM